MCSDRGSQSTQAERTSRRAPLLLLRGPLRPAQLGSRRKKFFIHGVNLLRFPQELGGWGGGSSLLKSALCLQKSCSCKTRHLISVNLLPEGQRYSTVTATTQLELTEGWLTGRCQGPREKQVPSVPGWEWGAGGTAEGGRRPAPAADALGSGVGR